jgi:hypothetical protein
MGMTGEEIIYAYRKGTVWNTAVQAIAGDGFLGLPWSAEPDNGTIVDDSLGVFFPVEAIPGQTKIEPAVTTYLRYNDEVILSMLASFFGTAGVPVTHATGTLSKDHVLKMAKNVDGIFGTLCAKIGTGFVQEIPSWKIAKVVITWESGKPAQFQFFGPGTDLLEDSTVNTLTTFNSVTILEMANRGYLKQTAFRMNDQSGAALSGTDVIKPTKVVLTLERKLSGQYGSYFDGGAGRDVIDEPTNDGQPTGTLSITYPRLKDTVGRLKIKSNTPQKMDIAMTGPIIETTIPYSMGFTLTNLVPTKSSSPHKHGTLDETRDYLVLGAVVAPLGMTGQTDPAWCTLTNKIATDLLA